MSNLDIGVPQDYLIPGIYLGLNFGVGPSTASAGQRSVLYVLPKLSTGSWQVNQPIQVSNETQALQGAGAGSPLHRALRKHFQTSKRGKVYAYPFAPTSGVGTEYADGYIAFAGTATSSGSVKVTIAGESFTVVYSTGTTGTAIGELVEAKANGILHSPCSANNVTGTVTLTAKTPGETQNDRIRFRAELLTGTGVTISTSGDTLDGGADGTTTEAANFASALSGLQTRYYYIATYYDDATNLAALETKLVQDSDPLVGRRQVAITASNGSLANAKARAIALNHERIQIALQQDSEWTPEQLAAKVAATRQFKENKNSRAGYSGWRGDSELVWGVPPVYSEASKFSVAELQDALQNGVTPIQSDENGSYIVKAVTTRSKDNSGQYNDTRALFPHRVSVVDEMADTISVRHSNQYQGKDFGLMDDPRTPRGDLDFEAVIPPKTVTPRIWSSLVLRVLDEFAADGKIQRLPESKASLDVQIASGNTSRIECGFEVYATDLFDQATVMINEVSPG